MLNNVNGVSRKEFVKSLAVVGGGVAVFGLGACTDNTPNPTQTTQDKDSTIKNKDTFIIATIGAPDTLDPAAAYDTASGEVIQQVYDTLINYDGESTTKFVGLLATEWTTSPDGKTIRFRIRPNVKFSNGETLTPADVEYSFERGLVQDYVAGPQVLLYEPLFGTETDSTNVSLTQIMDAVKVDGEWVQFNLKTPYEPFFQLLCGSWGSIVNKKWCIQQGDWDGTEASYKKLNRPKPNAWPLQKLTMGTGPFVLDYWNAGTEVSLVKNPNYWRSPANFNRVTIKVVDEWATRKLMLQNGDADYAVVPAENYPEMTSLPNIKLYERLPSVSLDGAFFVLNVNPQSAYIGSGKLDGAGITPDFFTDVNVRKAFNYCFDWTTYITQVLLGYGTQPNSPVVKGLSYYNANLNTKYAKDLTKATELFKAAWGGQLWDKGFTMTLAYNSGNASRKTACDILAANISSLNPKFKVTSSAQQWSSYGAQRVAHNLPVFVSGWLPDFMDAHNFILPWMSTKGAYNAFTGWGNATVDALIAKGINSASSTERQSIYDQLAQIYYTEAPGILLVQPTPNRYFKDWVKGFYFNPALPSNAGYIYGLSKTYK